MIQQLNLTNWEEERLLFAVSDVQSTQNCVEKWNEVALLRPYLVVSTKHRFWPKTNTIHLFDRVKV